MKTCPNCGKQISEFALSCPFCGNADMKNCALTAKPQKSYAGIQLPTRTIAARVAVATAISVLTMLIWRFSVCCFYSEYGEATQVAFTVASKFAIMRSTVLLLLSGIVYWTVITLVRKNKFTVIIIFTVIFSVAQFFSLNNIGSISTEREIWKYFALYMLRMLAVVYGIGITILQSLLLVVSISIEKKYLYKVGAIAGTFLLFSILGAFVGISILGEGTSGGLWGLCGIIAALISTILISRKGCRS